MLSFWETLEEKLSGIWSVRVKVTRFGDFISCFKQWMHQAKLVIIFKIARKELWRNHFIIRNNVFVVLVHVYFEITKNVQLFFIGIEFVKVCIYIFKKITLIRSSINNCNNYRFGFRQKNFNKNTFDFLWKKVFLYVTYVNSNIANYTSTVSVPTRFEELIFRYLDFWLKNGFIKVRFRYSNNSDISTCSYISSFIYSCNCQQ